MKLNHFSSVIDIGENKEYLFPTLRICRIASGSFDWQIGANIYSFKIGDVVLLNNLTPRRIINKNSETLHIDIFEFSPIEIQNRPLLVQAFYNAEPAIISSGNGKLIKALLSDVSRAYLSVKNQDFYDHMMQAIFDLLEDTFSYSLTHTNYSSTAFHAARFIWDHFTEDITVPTVADHLNVSKNHLEKIFKQVHGVCVGAYIRSIRIYHFMSLLKSNPNGSVLDIALTCGFNSSSGFYKAYKAVTGTNPRSK